jgi:Membrane bound beta barrel domain (DUF5777)
MKKSITLFVLLALCICAKAQKRDTVKTVSSADSLMNSLSADGDKHQTMLSTFSATRLIFSPTTETVKKKNLNFLVIHRFGDIGTSVGGPKTDFGLDAINDVYIGFEYGISDNLNINFGRSTIGQLLEYQLKYAILHQTSDNSSPIAITVDGGMGIRPYQQFADFTNRISYIAEAIFSRKFSPALSLEVSPVFVSNNQPIPNEPGFERGFMSVTAAGRLKVTKHMSVLVDYEHPFSNYSTKANGFEDPLGFGTEFETGGHVFTLNITNARAVSQINTLSASQQAYGRGQLRFGFTIARMFDFNHKKDTEKK